MDTHEQPEQERAEAFISIRLKDEDKALVVQAAEREGLQLSSFFIMLLVRCRILPESRLGKVKRRPVMSFNALHGLLGVVNRIGGNCKQLAVHLPDSDGLVQETKEALIRVAAAITDCMKGKPIPEGVNLYRIQKNLTRQGYALNELVKIMNTGGFVVAGLSEALILVRVTADNAAIALGGGEDSDTLTDMAMEEMRGNMRNREPKS